MTLHPGTGETVTPGTALRCARQVAGLSVADAAAQMRISARQVEALEADRYTELPGAVFVRGFIRNYARVLKLDPVPLLHALEPALDQEAPLRAHAITGTLPVSARRDHSRLLLVLFGILFIAVVGAGGYELWSRQVEQTSGSAGQGKPADRSAVQMPAQPVTKPEPPAVQPLPLESAPSEPVPMPASVAESAAAPSPAVVDPAPEVASSTARGARVVRIGMRFTRESWVEIRDREGKVVFSGTGPAASERALEASPPLSVVIGNAGAVQMTYNDKPLDLASHAARNIARFTLE